MITKNDILSNSIFKVGFESERYKNYLDAFISNVNSGSKLEVKTVMHDLIELAVSYCGISVTYRTIPYDFAWAALDSYPECWNEKEKENGLCNLTEHWKEFYPEDDGLFSNYDVAALNLGEYLVFALNMLINEINEEKKPMFSYAAYLFFVRNKLQFTEEDFVIVKKLISR